MAEHHNLLIEIGCEELPPQSILKLITAFKQEIQAQLQQAELSFSTIQCFSTPRRLALVIQDLIAQQPRQLIKRRGPTVAQAFDKQGQATAACLGFANSCGVDISELKKESTNKGTCLVYHTEQAGADIQTLLPTMINKALKQLPIPKAMRWSNLTTEFIRPVHWVVLMYGSQIIQADILGQTTSNITYGHRFHHPQAITLSHADDYQHSLQHAYVIPNFEERRALIKTQIEDHVATVNGTAIIPETLLDEVTHIVEWPIALLATFDKSFLTVPAEALISAMQGHQKCFAIRDHSDQLLPYFVFVSNISSHNPQHVIAGNEKVMQARLSDAKFFFAVDSKVALSTRMESLKSIVFHHKVGSLYDKVQRMHHLATYIAQLLAVDTNACQHATDLAKTDLVTDMVLEFPELQGIMGYYYAINEQLPTAIAIAIRDHYKPRFSGDVLPENDLACIIAITDRVDTVTTLFALGQPPSGDKDPFALRRAALGTLRIMIDRKLPLDLKWLSQQALSTLTIQYDEATLLEQLMDFYFERLRAYYLAQGIAADTLAAVIARRPTEPLDFAKRINAVEHFRTLATANHLAAANKRVANLLRKQTAAATTDTFDATLAQQTAEQILAKSVAEHAIAIQPLRAQQSYTELLCTLATLQEPIDRFFAEVMVMVEDPILRNNRIALLQQLRELFLQVADLSLLQS